MCGPFQDGILFFIPRKSLLLALIEVKLEGGNFGLLATLDATRQTACYSIFPLANSRWGLSGQSGNDALVSLVISPNHVYRMSLTKAEDKDFGLQLKLEHTDDK
jgi:hypothetical protein